MAQRRGAGSRVSVRLVLMEGLEMADSKPQQLSKPGMQQIPYVVLKRANGTFVLRHPDEIKSVPGQSPAKE